MSYAPFDVDDGHPYADLGHILSAAFTQASAGKGKERHANGLPWAEQPIIAINDLLGSQDGSAYQVIKKTREALQMYREGKTDSAIHEMHGAIVYAASVVLLMESGAGRRDGETGAAE